ncbi:MAG: glycosyltransferase [Cyclobacteriaceae bacterium]
MKILFLAPYPLKAAPSQRFRFEQYFDLLQANGMEYSFQSFYDQITWEVLYKKGNSLKKGWGLISGFLRRLKLLFSIFRYDRVFIHREVAPIGPPVFEWLIANVFNKKIIYDFDDAIWLPNTSTENTMISGLKWHNKVASICKWSHVVSVGNAYLGEYSSQFNRNTFVNPTTIDIQSVHVPSQKSNDLPIIGWTGTHSTGKYLEQIIEVLKEIAQEVEYHFIYISNKPSELDIPNMEFVQWSATSEIEDLNRIDIGLMPLEDDEWAKGKCGFKALQYMALEIPALVSPVGVNVEIVDDGVNGFLCSNSEQWKNCINQLLKDESLRRQLGKEGRRKVIEKYSVQSNQENFLSIIKA